MDAQTQAQVERLVSAYAAQAALQDLRARQSATSLWAGFAEWYSAAAVAELASQAVANSTAAQQVSAGLAQQYASTLFELMRGAAPRTSPKALALSPIRLGADMLEVHSRPAAKYRRQFAFSGDPDVAKDAALERAQDLFETDQLLARRDATQQTFQSLGVTHLRRVIHPELSKSGTCGLCATASTRIYSVDELQPIHVPECKYTTVIVNGDDDPGATLNEKDLASFYEQAGGTSAAKLKRIRIRQHGEYGPTLVDADHRFTTEKEAAAGQRDTPESATRQLSALRPVLADLERRGAAGDDVTDPLRYQRGLIARLEAIAPPQ